AAGRGRRGRLRAAGRAGGRRSGGAGPREIPARDRRQQEVGPPNARGRLRQAAEPSAVRRRHLHGRGDRHPQHLLGAHAGDDSRGGSARLRPGDGAGRWEPLSQVGAAERADHRGRRQVPLDRRRVHRRQGHARPDHGAIRRGAPGVRLGKQPRLSDSGSSPRAARTRADAAAPTQLRARARGARRGRPAHAVRGGV
ncbi:MAG: Ribonuclease HII, partial [uncultured Sphingomonas sp.]